MTPALFIIGILSLCIVCQQLFINWQVGALQRAWLRGDQYKELWQGAEAGLTKVISFWRTYYPKQRLARLEKAYKAQLKKQYKKQYRGPHWKGFGRSVGIVSNNRGFFMHSFNEAQNQRHWLESLRLGALACYKKKEGEEEARISNHKQYLQTAKGFLYISPQLP